MQHNRRQVLEEDGALELLEDKVAQRRYVRGPDFKDIVQIACHEQAFCDLWQAMDRGLEGSHAALELKITVRRGTV